MQNGASMQNNCLCERCQSQTLIVTLKQGLKARKCTRCALTYLLPKYGLEQLKRAIDTIEDYTLVRINSLCRI